MNFEGSRLNSESTLVKIVLLCILVASAVVVLRNLGHSGITYWDEGFHAVVARNLTKHPLKFTLYDQPWLPYDYKGWGENHIWLHKPPVAMWTIWLSHLIFGINTFALRLPSAISLVVTTWLTFRIASNLFDKRAGLIAAFLQAFNPFLFESVHGYRYSDHIDIALLLWVQVSCWFLLRAIRTGKRRNYILSGVCDGCCVSIEKLPRLHHFWYRVGRLGGRLVYWMGQIRDPKITAQASRRADIRKGTGKPQAHLTEPQGKLKKVTSVYNSWRQCDSGTVGHLLPDLLS